MTRQDSEKWWKVPGPERVRAEAARVEAMLRAAAPPVDCGPEMPVAPARGPFRVFEPRVTAPGGRLVHDGYRGQGEARHRKAIARLDVFDVMTAQARRRSKDAPPLFTAAQVAAGRAYAELTERAGASGYSGTSLEVSAVRVRGAGNGDWIEARLRDSRRLDRMRAAIGLDYALGPSDLRRHMDRGLRHAIPVRVLVDAVCLDGLTITEIIRARGWPARTTTIASVRASLCAALDRIYDSGAV
jgi:hypothetical protein